jgi:AmmeMemoRadiSam system protein A
MELSDELKRNLLKLARKTIEQELFGKSDIAPDLDFPELQKVAGVFVTLHKKGNLRGCIGNIVGRAPLKDTVKNMAVAAAFQDPRFPSLSKDEYEEIDLEITVLSEPKPAKAEEIQEGRHGVVLTRDGKQGTYLPQVWDQLPEKTVFLSSLCMKAGMEKDCWTDPNTRIQTYEGIDFSEKDLGLK